MVDEQSVQKRCTKCGETKSIELFSRDKGKKDGRCTQCKICIAQYRRTWYIANAEAAREYNRVYEATNITAVRERQRAYQAANADTLREYRRAYYALNIQTIREYQRVHRATHPDVRRAYYAANAEAIREYQRARRATNPDLHRTAKHRRRARIKGNGGSFTSQELKHMRLTQGGFCAYCQSQHQSHTLTIDHIIPLKQGGRHEAANIVLACGTCNSSKGNRTPDQWLNRWYYHC